MDLYNSLQLSGLACLVCGDLEPVDDANIESSFNAVCDSADKGCESCILLRQTVVDCASEVVVQNDPSPIYVVVRRSILRSFIEVAVRSVRPAKTVIVDIFIPPGRYIVRVLNTGIIQLTLVKAHTAHGQASVLGSRLLATPSRLDPSIVWTSGSLNALKIILRVGPMHGPFYHRGF
jgi:hypothetical protein